MEVKFDKSVYRKNIISQKNITGVMKPSFVPVYETMF